MMKVIKRDGRLQELDLEKIKISILSATNESKELLNESDVKILVEDINSKIKELNLEKNVKLMGLSDNMYDEYKNYGIFVLTSYREGFSLVLLEAKANALPLVSFDCVAGPSEIISNNVDGYLIPCYNIEMMSKKISELINKSDLRKKFSTNSQLNVDKFKKSAIIEKWKRIIDEL